MQASEPVYMELVDLVAGGSTPENIVRFHTSSQAQGRVAELIEGERESRLTEAETAEL